MKIAVCFSGHIRDVNKCIDNIEKNLLTPLRKIGTIDVFCSTWKEKGHRSEKWVGDAELSSIRFLNPTGIIIESPKRDTFLRDYQSRNWHQRYSTWETSGDSASMWYKAQSAFSLCGPAYDIVVRARFDILYDNEILLPEVIAPRTVYMPISHGKYHEVTNGIMDHFAYGDYKSMEVYFSTFSKIPKLIADGTGPFTGEGYLYNTLLNNVEIVRIPLTYSVQRKDKIERVV